MGMVTVDANFIGVGIGRRPVGALGRSLHHYNQGHQMRKKRDTDDGRCELKDDKGTLSKPDGATFPVDGQCSKCENGVIIKTEDNLCSPRKQNRKGRKRSKTRKAAGKSSRGKKRLSR